MRFNHISPRSNELKVRESGHHLPLNVRNSGRGRERSREGIRDGGRQRGKGEKRERRQRGRKGREGGRGAAGREGGGEREGRREGWEGGLISMGAHKSWRSKSSRLYSRTSFIRSKSFYLKTYRRLFYLM